MCLLVRPCVFGQDSHQSHANNVNQFDKRGRKHGYWEVYINEEFRTVKKGEHRYIYYTFYENGSTIVGYIGDKLRDRRIQITYDLKYPGDTLLNGRVRIVSKDGSNAADCSFEFGLLKEETFTSIHDDYAYITRKNLVRNPGLDRYPIYEYWQDQNGKGGWLFHLVFDFNKNENDSARFSFFANEPCNAQVKVESNHVFIRPIGFICKEDSTLITISNSMEACFIVKEKSMTLGFLSMKKKFPFKYGISNEQILQIKNPGVPINIQFDLINNIVYVTEE